MRLWRVFIYVCTHLGLVFQIIWNNYKKKSTRLQIGILRQINFSKFGDQIEIEFKQKGAFLIVINKEYLVPVVKGDGKFKIPVALLHSNKISIHFVGLFQLYSKILTASIPESAILRKQPQPAGSLLERIHSVKVNKDKTHLTFRLKQQIRFARNVDLVEIKRSTLTLNPINFQPVEIVQPELFDLDQVKNELNKIKSHEK